MIEKCGQLSVTDPVRVPVPAFVIVNERSACEPTSVGGKSRLVGSTTHVGVSATAVPLQATGAQLAPVETWHV